MAKWGVPRPVNPYPEPYVSLGERRGLTARFRPRSREDETTQSEQKEDANMMRTTLIAVVMLAGLGVSAAVAWGLGMFGRTPDGRLTTQTENTNLVQPTGKSGMDQALEFITTARSKFANVKDYRAMFLRDELIDGEFKENYLTLKVRHEPFSVFMEWHAPASKAGRKSIYIEGQNNGKMRVREKVAGNFAVTVSLDPEESKKRKESRHTILEAGYKNLCEKYVKSWTKEKDLGLTQVVIEEG